MTDKYTLSTDIPAALLQGRILAMTANLEDELRKGMIAANGAVLMCMKSRTEMVESLITATLSSGLSQAAGQIVGGTCSMASGAFQIGGGALEMVSAAKQANALSDLEKMTDNVELAGSRATPPRPALESSNDIELTDMGVRRQPAHEVELQGNRVGGSGEPVDPGANRLSAAEKAAAKAKIEEKWGGYEKLGKLLAGAGGSISQGAGQLGQAPYTALAAAQQAESQKAQALSDAANSLMQSSEGANQNSQGFFSQLTQIPANAMQWAIVMAQAH